MRWMKCWSKNARRDSLRRAAASDHTGLSVGLAISATLAVWSASAGVYNLDRAVRDAYGLPGPATPEQLTQISDSWRPYRTWVTLLLRTQQEISAAGELRWGEHEVASRVPLAVRFRCDHNQGGRDWTKRRRDPGPAAVLAWPGEHLTG